MTPAADVVRWKAPHASFTLSETVDGLVTFSAWSDPAIPQPDQATFDTWRAEYLAAAPALEAETAVNDLFDHVTGAIVTALLEHFDALRAASEAGTLQGDLSTWRERIRSRAQILQRALAGR